MQSMDRKQSDNNKFYKTRKFSIIIPTLNEGKNLKLLVEKIFYYLKGFNFEIIIVDDNSSDNTKSVLNYLKKRYLNLTFFIRKCPPDLSQSVIKGFEKSKYESILVMDADMQHNPIYLPRMVTLFFKKNKDFVVSTRDFNKKLGINIIRKNFSKAFIILINYTFGFKTKDPMSGFFIFKKKFFKKNRKKLFGKGFKILFDLLYSEKILDVQDLSIKFDMRKNNTSKMSIKIIFLLIQSIFFKFKKNKFN
jgi:dolichol-phosphate mannosyltransferase